MLLLNALRAVTTWARSRVALRDDEGATLVEYGLLVALIAVAVMATLTLLGVQINDMFCSVLNEIGGTCGTSS